MENNIGALLLEAGNLLVVGMLVVFSFLGMLIFLMKIMSNLVGGDAPVVNAPPTSRPNTSRGKTGSQQDQKVKAAISAAIHQYRQDNK